MCIWVGPLCHERPLIILCVRASDVTSLCDVPKAPRSLKPQRVQGSTQPPDGAQVQPKVQRCGFGPGWALCSASAPAPFPWGWGARARARACGLCVCVCVCVCMRGAGRDRLTAGLAPARVHGVAILHTASSSCHDPLGTAHTPCPANSGSPGICVQTAGGCMCVKQIPSSLPLPRPSPFTPARLPLTMVCPSLLYPH